MVTCALCYCSLDDAVQTGAGLQCPSCNHLWQVVDGKVRATNPKREALTAADVTALTSHDVA